MVHEAVSEPRESVQQAAETTAKAVEAIERVLEEAMGSLIAWAACYGVDVSDARDAQMTLRFDGVGLANREKPMAGGLCIWKQAGMPKELFRQARVRFSDGSMGQAWRFLNTG